MRRYRWFAALLSFFVPGTGQLYNGEYRKGFWILAAVLGLYPLVLLATVGPSHPHLRFAVFALAVLSGVGLYVWAILDAFRRATAPAAMEPRPILRRWFVLVPLVLVIAFAVRPAERNWMRQRLGSAFSMPSGSMAPTLQVGDYFLAQPIRSAHLRTGQVVLHASLTDPSITVVRRVVGLPGDTVLMRDGIVFRNGRRLAEPYLDSVHLPDEVMDTAGPTGFRWQLAALAPSASRATYRPSRDNWGALIIPAQHVFTLGDSRDQSLDSRYVGFVPFSSVRGQPTWVYFSYDREHSRVRWSRLGLGIQ